MDSTSLTTSLRGYHGLGSTVAAATVGFGVSPKQALIKRRKQAVLEITAFKSAPSAPHTMFELLRSSCSRRNFKSGSDK
jgi:hypothetical protein